MLPELVPDLPGISPSPEALIDVGLLDSGRLSRLKSFFEHKSLILGTLFCVVTISLVLLAPVLAPVSPNLQNSNAILAAPSSSHLMGTDQLGRDIFSRLLYGGRYTIGSSIAVVILGGIVGSIVGLVAGYVGGAVGFVLMRIVDLLLAFPGILLALAVDTILGPDLRNAVVAVALIAVPVYARIVEGAAVQARALPYVDAAISLGATTRHIIWKHILPSARAGIIVQTTGYLGIAALWISALGFLGLGVQPPTPEWGSMLASGQSFITIAWWVTVFPGIFLALYVVGVNLIGDGLRDKLDPTLVAR
jgi:ABC-type dipeptide/oligopeptide/nickel transport system permease subunit